MQIGLVGRPYTGKTTLFNLLTGSAYETGLSGKREVLTGNAAVPDKRIEYLARLYKPQKTVYAQIQFKDIPGVHSGDGAGAANKLLEEVRGADALVQVVRAFQEDMVGVVTETADPSKELADFASDLVLADMVAVENRLKRIENTKKPSKDALTQAGLLKSILTALENEQRLSELKFSEAEKSLIADQNFLTEKPLVVVVNIDEKQLSSNNYPGRDKLLNFASNHQIPVIEVCARIEMEINQLPKTERDEFLKDLGLTESGINHLAHTAYNLLGLISFFTVGQDEVRAWTIRKGTKTRRAAGKVHSDIERGFIRAEVFHFEDIKHLGSVSTVKEKGLFRLEGKEYIVKDGDIISFRFNV